jgi:tetratricopeptide (TPR) repeat protein
LQRRKLIESFSQEFWLHPVIQAEAQFRLQIDVDQWHQINIKAAEYWTDSIEQVLDIQDLRIALEAYYHYCAIDEYGLAVEIIVKRRGNTWGRDEKLGSALWRFGLFAEIREICLNLYKILPSHPLAHLLCNLIGDAYWMSGNPQRGIEFHSKITTKEVQPVDTLEDIRATSTGYIGIALCCFDLWRLEDCLQSIQKNLEIIERSNIFSAFLENIYSEYKFVSLSFLAVVKSEIKKDEDIDQNILDSKKLYDTYSAQSHLWSHAYCLIFLGRTSLNLGNMSKGKLLLEKALSFSSKSSFFQGQAKAQSLLGESYRNQDNDRSLDYQQTAIQTLDKISAICDLAEAYFFQALTYRDMGNSVKAQESLDRAQELYRSFDAPLQIERTNKAFYQP